MPLLPSDTLPEQVSRRRRRHARWRRAIAMTIAFTLLASLTPPTPVLAQSPSVVSAEPGLITRVASWLSGTVAGWFAEEPKGEMRPSGQKITLPGRAGASPALKVAAPKAPGKRVKELTSERTAVSKTFELEDGRRQVEISSQRVHVLGPDGRWTDADTTITAIGEDGDAAVSDGAGFAARFGTRSDRLVRVGLGDAQLTLGLAGAARDVPAEVSKSAVRYRGALGAGADLVYQVGAAGVKEQIVLSGPQAIQPSYAFTVQVAGGLRAEARPDGSVAFTDPAAGADSEPVFVIPRPFMTDASRADKQAASFAGGFSTAVSQSVAQQGSQVTLTLTPDAGWLGAAERSWPVVIDPTVVVQPDYWTSDDAMIVSYAPTVNFGADVRLGAGVDGSGPARSVVRFDLAGVVEPDAVIDQAEVGLYYDQVVGGSVTPMTLEAREVTQPWNWSTVTWNSISTAMGATPLSTDTFDPATPSVWNTWDVTTLAQRWATDPDHNYGVMIKPANESVPVGGPIYWAGEFQASEVAAIPMPRLTLTYGSPGMRVKQPQIRHSTGAELAWEPYDGPGELVGYQVHRASEAGFTPTTATMIAPLDKQAITYQDTTATPGATVVYKVAALLADGTPVMSAPLTVELPEVGWTTALVEAAADTTLTTCDFTNGHDQLSGLPQLAAGFMAGPYGNGRMLLRFDTGFIPAGAKISSARAIVYRVGYRGRAVSYATHALTRDWDEASASWVGAAPGTAWTTPGGDINPTPMEAFTIGPTATSAFLPLDIPTTVAQGWVDEPGSNHGMMMRLIQEPAKSCPASGDGALFLSGEAEEPTVRPRLEITYLDPAVAYHAPATPPQLTQGQTTTVPVTVTNSTDETWLASRTALGYFWKLPDGTDVTGDSQMLTQLPSDLAPAATVTVKATVKAPTLASPNLAEAVSLVWDTQDTETNNWKSASHHIPQLPQQIRVDSPTSNLLGLEKFYAYTGKNTGGGGTALVNPYAGNVVWSYNAFSNPSRGVQTFVRTTYNSLDTSSASLGYGWSLQTSTLSKLGSQLDFHPPGQTWPEQVRLTDGDGTTHAWLRDPPTCTANCAYKNPRGVHLYLQKTGSADPLRTWVFTKPDRTQFFFDTEGFQSAIVDKNGNTMSFTYERRKSNNKPTKFLQYITDAAGRKTLSLDYHVKGQDYTYIDDENWQPVQGTKLTNPHIIDTVESITDIAGRTMTFAYTDKGLLARMIDGAGDEQAKTFGFEYDATQGNKNVKLVNVKDPRGHETKLAYYTAQVDSKNLWKLQTLTDRKGGETDFAYEDLDGPQDAVIHVTVTDPIQQSTGKATKYVLDAYGRPDLITNAKEEITDLEWDEDHNVRSLKEANGATTTWQYDPKTGYPEKIWDAEANEHQTAPTTLEYDRPENFKGYVADLTSKSSPEARTWEFDYDTRGNLTKVTDPLGVSTSDDPDDYATTHEYDSFGQPTKTIDANGNPTVLSGYHSTGYPQKITDAYGVETAVEGDHTTTTEYDVRGNVLSVTDALGKKTTQTYDIFKRPLESKVPKDQDNNEFIVTPAPVYDRNDNITKTTAPNGAVATAIYDEADQLTESLLPKDTDTAPERKTTYTWDLAGNLSSETEPAGNVTSADPNDFVTHYRYDPIYQLTDVINADQQKLTYTYDNVGNVRTVIDPRKNAQTAGTATLNANPSFEQAWTADTATVPWTVEGGALERVTDQIWAGKAAAKLTPSGSDAEVKLWSERTIPVTGGQIYTLTAELQQPSTDVPVHVGVNWIDTEGTVLRTDSISPDLNQGAWTQARVSFTAPATAVIGQLRLLIDGTPSASTVLYVDDFRLVESAGTQPSATYTHDLNHRVMRVKDAAGYESATEYDLDGLALSTTDEEGNTSFTVYDKRGDVIETRAPHAETNGDIKYVTTRFDYDEAGNKTKTITPRGVETTDDADDFVSETRYDKLNRPVEEIYPFDKDDPVYNQPDSTLYAYDALSRLKEISAPPSHGQTVRNITTMTYWDNGWSKTTTDPWDIKTTYDYNELGLQTNRTITSAGGSSQRALDWEYYPDGKLKAHSDKGVPLGLDVVMGDNSDTGQVASIGSWTVTTGGTPSSSIVGPQASVTATEGFVGYDYAVAPAGTGQGTFTWNLSMPSAGTYRVKVSYPPGASATNAKYTIKHDGGEAHVTVDQTQNAGSWVDLGNYTFTGGLAHSVTLTDDADGTIVADAIMLVRDTTNTPDTEDNTFSYSYDTNANLTKITDASPNAKIDTWEISYTGLNQVEQILEKLDGDLKNTTRYAYNENSAPIWRSHDKTISGYGYDTRDLVQRVVDARSTSVAKPKVTSYRYTPRAETLKETKANGNTVDFDYFLSGVLRHSVERKPNAAIVAEHTLGYQGNLQKATDHAKIQNADSPSAYLEHDYAYNYDPRDRIAKSVKTPVGGGPVETETYSHDANSNVWEEEVLGRKTTFTYDRNRLMTSVTDGQLGVYNYDPYGRLRTIIGGGKTLEKYTYDGFDHVVKHEKLGGDGATTTTTYTYDPLDRTTSKTEKEGSAAAKTTQFSYLGLSGEVLDEEVAGKLVRSFQYSPWGSRLSQVKVGADGSEENSYYGYNSHTDVEQITTDAGDTRATYGYTAYGKNDDKLFTGVDKPDPVDPTAKEEYNPYRFNAKRWDNSTGLYDMGFRDYSPGLNRFLSLDSYNGALDDLSLSMDPWTANRYAFTGGNPIGGIELDGHSPDPGQCGNTLATPCTGSPGHEYLDSALDDVTKEALEAVINAKRSGNEAAFKRLNKKDPKAVSWAMSCGPGGSVSSGAVGKVCSALINYGIAPELVRNFFRKSHLFLARDKAAGEYILPWTPSAAEQFGDFLWYAGSMAIGARGGKARGVRPCSSFPMGTKVLMADGSYKNIEDVRPGDEVMATKTGTGETEGKAVIDVLMSAGKKTLIEITIRSARGRDQKSKLVATDRHPFWIPELGDWLDAEELRPGMLLRTSTAGDVQVVTTRKWSRNQIVRNLSVADYHTYYVAAQQTPVLVHNSSGCPVRLPDFNSFMSAYRHYAKHVLGVLISKTGKQIKAGEAPGMPEFKSGGFAAYRSAARNFMGGAGPEGSISLATKGGGMFRVDPKTGYFGYMNSSGTISTFFRVTHMDPVDYFWSQFKK
ncbi:DNRLRE domain-containing protein [Nonomuraea sp. M3C6]|uniref:DNRLRE domain-containing protein n=1 Tax=Nonomuraea marmarensis TaxID=3351344 RepID=A0ABW7AJD4_9ACTN